MSESSELHLLPCNIEYDGPAPVKSYFVQKSGKNGEKIAYLRGHELVGEVVDVSKDWVGVLAAKASNKSDLDSEHNQNKGNNEILLMAEGKFDSFTIWQHDAAPNKAQIEELLEWKEVANSLHDI